MTVFGPDISSFEAGLNLAAMPDASFVIAKASEGTYYTDPDYAGWRTQAAGLGRLFAWYHFLTTENTAAQLAHAKACVGDVTLPGMLDVEPQTQTGSRPTLTQVYAFADAAHAAGWNLRLVYLPEWYWAQIGSPDLTGLTARGLYLVSSNYPGGSGNPEALYPGDSGPGWRSYGGVTPLLWQYTDKAADGGRTEDFNAFRGSVAQLRAYLGTAAPTTTGGTMGTIPASIGQKWPEIAAEFPASGTFDDESALIWADGGARAAAFYAKQARDAVTALSARVVTPVPMDTTALAAAIVAKMPAPAAVDPAPIAAAVATALEQHGIGGVDEQVLAGEIVTEIAARLAKGGA